MALRTTTEPVPDQIHVVSSDAPSIARPAVVLRRAPGEGAAMVSYSTFWMLMSLLRAPSDALFLIGFWCVVASLFEFALRKSRVAVAEHGLEVYGDFSSKPRVIEWAEIRKVTHVGKAGQMQVDLAHGEPWSIPDYATAAVLPEVARRCGPAVFGERDRRSPWTAPVEGPIPAPLCYRALLAAYEFLLAYALMMGGAAFVQWQLGRWYGVVPVLIPALLGLVWAFKYVETSITTCRGATATVDEEGVTVRTGKTTRRVHWKELRFALQTGRDEKYSNDRLGSLLLIDDKDEVWLPSPFTLRELVVRHVLAHAPEDAALYGIRR